MVHDDRVIAVIAHDVERTTESGGQPILLAESNNPGRRVDAEHLGKLTGRNPLQKSVRDSGIEPGGILIPRSGHGNRVVGHRAIVGR